MKKVAIIQARMGSKRLPNKVLYPVNGKPLLHTLLERASKAKSVDQFVVATSTMPEDDRIAEFCAGNGIDHFRGHPVDVLDRYYHCAREFQADTIIRICADCPLIDPQVIDDTLQWFLKTKVDYAASNIPVETSHYPDGSDAEVFSFQALERAFKEATDPADREHVTFFIWKKNNGFKLSQVKQPERNMSKYRFTVDYPEDQQVVEFLIKELEKMRMFGTIAEIVSLLDDNPQVMKLNSHYYYGMGWQQKPEIVSRSAQ